MYIHGINPALNYQATLEEPIPHIPGTRGKDNQGREYVFCTTAAAQTAGDVVMLPLAQAATPTPLTTAAALYNRQVGVVASTFAAFAGFTGFWAQVQGQALVGIRTSAAVAINVPLYTTATANALDDTAAASNLVRGITLTVAAGGAAVAAGLINYPTIGTVADTDNPA